MLWFKDAILSASSLTCCNELNLYWSQKHFAMLRSWSEPTAWPKASSHNKLITTEATYSLAKLEGSPIWKELLLAWTSSSWISRLNLRVQRHQQVVSDVRYEALACLLHIWPLCIWHKTFPIDCLFWWHTIPGTFERSQSCLHSVSSSHVQSMQEDLLAISAQKPDNKLTSHTALQPRIFNCSHLLFFFLPVQVHISIMNILSIIQYKEANIWGHVWSNDRRRQWFLKDTSNFACLE